MTRTTLGRRIVALEQAQPTTLPLSIQRWLGEPLTHDQHRAADSEIEARDRFVGPHDLRLLEDSMLAWLSVRGDFHAA